MPARYTDFHMETRLWQWWTGVKGMIQELPQKRFCRYVEVKENHVLCLVFTDFTNIFG